MKAAIYRGPRSIHLEEVPMPETAEDELLVRIKPCSIAASALHMYRLGKLAALSCGS
jgi:threonine dehydrogenase-like Zn-dependent dehydrogenase